MGDRLPRKLAAILYADVAGYSRLTGEDEDATHRRLAEYLDQITVTVDGHGGRVMHYAGDAVLAMFEAVVDAVSCAAHVQSRLKARNEDLSDERKVQFRIGVNLGDIIEDRGDIYGDGVNVAARLESLGEPGGICISESVHTAVGNKLPFDYEFLGEQQVKNISKPVKAYHARLKPNETLPEPRGAHRKKQLQWFVVAVVVVLLVVMGGVLKWLAPWEPREEPASIDRMAFTLPDKPSIAVLPFTNMSDDEKQEYFVDGMTEDLITDLSKLSGLFVIARNSTFTYKGKSVKVRQVAEELGVRYVLEGSVRRGGGQLRINAQLIDAISGGHVWAERYDMDFSDVFTVQDKVTREIVRSLAVKLTPGEEAEREKSETTDPQAYDAFLRGWVHYRSGTPEDLVRAVSYFEEAIQLDSSYSRAYAALAAVYWTVVDRDRSGGTTVWSRTLGIDTDESRRLEEFNLQLALKDPTPLAYRVAAGRFSRQGRHQLAIERARNAIALDPGDPVAHEALAIALIYAGRPAAGEIEIQQAIRLDPLFSHKYLYWLGLAQFGTERFAEAAENLSRAAVGNPADDSSLIVLAATYGHLGRVEDARAAVDKANVLREKNQERVADADLQAGVDMLLAGPYTLKDIDLWPFQDQRDRNRLQKGLRLAGVPETGDSTTTSPLKVAGAITVDATAAKALFDRGALFVDVRGEDSWNSGHIPKAIHLALNTDFSNANLSAVAKSEQEIVIYCMGPRCLLSSQASVEAVSWGFQNVHYFRDGFPSWKAAGYAIEVQD